MARAITFQRSLFWNMTGGIAILVVLFLGVAVVNIEYARERLATDLTQRAVNDTRTTVDHFFQRVSELVVVSARHFAGVGADLNDPEPLDRHFMPLLSTVARVSGAIVAARDGGFYYLRRVDEGWQRLVRDPGWEAGRVLVTRWSDEDPEPLSEWQDTGYDARTRPWFQDAMAIQPPAERDPTYSTSLVEWTPPYRYPSPRNEHGVTASLTFETPDGSDYVVSFDVLLRDISTFTMDLRLKESGSVTVLYGDELDDELAVIGLPAGVAETPEEAIEKYLLAPPSAVGGPLVDYVAAMTAAPSDTQLEPRRFASGGKQWWGAGARYGSPARVLILALVPQNELVGQVVQGLAVGVLSSTLLVTLLGIWRSSRLSRQYARAIEELAGQTESMAGLNFEKGAEVRSRIEEIQTLALAQEQLRRSLEAISSRDENLLIARSMRAEEKLVSEGVPAGYELGVFDRCAEAVGGSVFDAAVHPDSETRLSLLIAVVPGEGVTTAYEAGRVRGVFQAAVRLGTSLAEQARQIRGHFEKLPQLQASLAVCVAEVDSKNHTLSLQTDACPVVHFAASTGTFRWIEPSVEPERIALGEGDSVLLLTESVLRVLSPARACFGREGLEEFVSAHATTDAETLAHGIGAALDEFSDASPLERDRTLVVLRRVAARAG